MRKSVIFGQEKIVVARPRDYQLQSLGTSLPPAVLRRHEDPYTVSDSPFTTNVIEFRVHHSPSSSISSSSLAASAASTASAVSTLSAQYDEDRPTGIRTIPVSRNEVRLLSRVSDDIVLPRGTIRVGETWRGAGVRRFIHQRRIEDEYDEMEMEGEGMGSDMAKGDFCVVETTKREIDGVLPFRSDGDFSLGGQKIRTLSIQGKTRSLERIGAGEE